MNFEPTAEQAMLRDTVNNVLAFHSSADAADLWPALADLGLLGLTFPESEGGQGAGPIEAMIVMSELGASPVRVPVLDSAYLPGNLVAEAASPAQRRELLPKIAAGQLRPAFAHEEPRARWPLRTLSTSAVRQGATWQVTGRKSPVLFGDEADLLIVSAAVTDGIRLFLVDPAGAGVSRRGSATYDGMSAADIVFTAAAAEPLASLRAEEAIEAALVAAQAALCAEAVGAMTEALHLTAEYLCTRRQFGVPLRTFQALAHRAADMHIAVVMAHGMSVYASMALADGVIDQSVASRAKLRIGRSARYVGQEAVQLHGGIGMTMDYPVGQYFARLTAIEQTFGNSSDHLRFLMSRVAEYDMVDL
ncbi:acyl-CoA dehydrogenase family protein [Nocardia sp. NBC_01327]|uniref:acyl-CoA dehydrogenase family protein n=1 Tax=Nocardia sp. NBC_01327 TaxID=2903593 RepID=UPI002E0ED1D4|nr:acyl-CoA dehydrogenase family protein [Nocardia sp. NBC_01327]